MLRALSALALTALFTAPALADEADPYASGPGSDLPTVSLTFSPVHLVLPVLELQLEVAVTPVVSVSAILGYGSVKVSGGGATESFSVFEVGGQFVYYALGDFGHGLQLGAEVMYLGVSADADGEFSGVFGRGLSLAPFVGYKVAADFGLTFMAQLGPAIFLVSAESDTETESDSAVGVMLNLNVGWSF